MPQDEKLWKTPELFVPIFIGLAIAFLNDFALDGLPLLLNDIRDSSNLTNEQVSLLRFLPIAGGLFFIFSASALCQRFGAKAVLNLALGCFCLGGILLALNLNLIVFLISLVLLGVASATARVSSYSMVFSSLSNAKRIAVFIAIYEAMVSAAFLTAPISYSLLLGHTDRGWLPIGTGIASIFGAFLILSNLHISRPAEQNKQLQSTETTSLDSTSTNWTFALCTGGLAALTVLIVILDAFLPQLTPYGVGCDIALAIFVVKLFKRSHRIQEDYDFIGNPIILFSILGIASTGLVDWYYFSQIFLTSRFNFELWQTSAWLSPTNFAGLVGASIFIVVVTRVGIAKTIAAALMFCLFLPIVYVTTSIETPVVMLTIAATSFAMFDFFVTSGLMARATTLVKKEQIANLQAVSRSFNLITWSLGSAVTSGIVLERYGATIKHQLSAGMTDQSALNKIAAMVSEGKRNLVLSQDWGTSANLIKRHLEATSHFRAEALISALHLVGILVFIMILITSTLFVTSLLASQKAKLAESYRTE